MNSDESEKCMSLAKKAISEGNWEKAERMLNKSIKLSETTEAKNLLSNLGELKSRFKYNTKPESSKPKSTPSTRPVSRRTSPPREERPYTPEQVKICSDIIKEKDYYKVLGVNRDANEAAMKKAYKKLAVKCHPDKNPAPQSTQAFKKVNAAIACLTDETKRRIYD